MNLRLKIAKVLLPKQYMIVPKMDEDLISDIHVNTILGEFAKTGPAQPPEK